MLSENSQSVVSQHSPRALSHHIHTRLVVYFLIKTWTDLIIVMILSKTKWL